MIYADTSALVRTYLADEPGHRTLVRRILGSGEPVVTSEIARLELVSAVHGAVRAGRLKDWRTVLDAFEGHCGPRGPIGLIGLRPEPVLSRAHEIVLRHRVRTLDAIHLAVAIEDAPGLGEGEGFTFLTRDARQASAAKALGLRVA